MKNTNHTHLLALDGLRFVAALSVVLGHGAVRLLNTTESTGWIVFLSTLPGIGMTLFFVLSGFVIHYNYHHIARISNPKGVQWFIVARLSRLCPLFFAVLLIDIVFSTPQLMHGNPEKLEPLFWHLVMMNSWFYTVYDTNSLIYQFTPVTPLSWSISTEIALYIIYLFLSPLAGKLRGLKTHLAVGSFWYVLFIAGFVLIGTRLPQINNWAFAHWGEVALFETTTQDSFFRWLLYFFPPARLMEFIMGMLAANFFMRNQPVPPSARETMLARWGCWALLVAIMAMHIMCYLPNGIAGMHIRMPVSSSIVYAPLMALLIYSLARYESPLRSFFSHRWMVKGGEASYSIYLLHFAFFARFNLPPEPSGSLRYMYDNILIFLLNLVVIIVVSRGVYLAFELPAQQWLRGLYKRSKFRYVVIPWLLVAAGVGAVSQLYHAEAPISVEGKINITRASYGISCTASPGNVTTNLMEACNGKENCDYKVDVNTLGDVAPGCGKDFEARWHCGNPKLVKKLYIKGEAGMGSIAAFNCRVYPGKVNVVSATYGASCKASEGNATAAIAKSCDNKKFCRYIIDVNALGDAAPGCAKDFKATWHCGDEADTQSLLVEGGTGLGEITELKCGK